MIIHDIEQGSPEWHRVRAGCITGSMFYIARQKVGTLTEQQARYVQAIQAGKSEKEAMIAAGYKAKPKSDAIEKAIAGEVVGDFSEAAKNYAFRLAVERISGKPLDEGFETWAMRRGQDREQFARTEHETKIDEFVMPAGFITTDDRKFGASADGFVGDDGGAEYKCLVDPGRIRNIIMSNDISEFLDQCQGGMWITRRKWWDFCLYCPALEPVGLQLWRKRIFRDDNYINDLEKDLIEFESLVSSTEKSLREYHNEPQKLAA